MWGGGAVSEKLSQLQPPSHWAGSSSLTQGMWLSQSWDFIQFTVQTRSPGPPQSREAECILPPLDWEPKARARNWQVPAGIRGL